MRSRPHIRASALTYDEAEELLIQSIQDKGGAMQTVLEFDPPLSKSTLDQKYNSTAIYLTCSDDRFRNGRPGMEVVGMHGVFTVGTFP